MRDRDKTVLQYLARAQSCIRSIQKQQQQSMKLQSEVEQRHLFGSTEDLTKTRLIVDVSDKHANTGKSYVSSGALCTSPDMLTPVTLTVDDDLLSSFLGEGKSVPSSKPAVFTFTTTDTPISNNLQQEKPQNRKLEENRKSAVSELQMLRRQLQQETKQELENFDKKFETPKLLEIEESKTSYRYSILNRMDELLNHKPNNDSSHVRQYSEPSMTGSVSEWALSSSNKKHHPKPDFHSFRYASKPTVMSRSDSAGVPLKGIQTRGTHYDTTVISKRKSRPSSRSSTLERQRNHPLHYSIDSLNSSELNVSDHDSPEHMSSDHKSGRVSPIENSHRHSLSNDSDSPEIHPEPLSPLSPLLTNIDSFMKTSQAFENYMYNGSKEPVVAKSAPLSRKSGFANKDTWL